MEGRNYTINNIADTYHTQRKLLFRTFFFFPFTEGAPNFFARGGRAITRSFGLSGGGVLFKVFFKFNRTYPPAPTVEKTHHGVTTRARNQRAPQSTRTCCVGRKVFCGCCGSEFPLAWRYIRMAFLPCSFERGHSPVLLFAFTDVYVYTPEYMVRHNSAGLG